MPRAKQSVSERIVADVLSLPHQEATLLVGYLATTLRLSGVLTLHSAKPPKLKAVKGPAAPLAEPGVASTTVMENPATQPIAVRQTRQPRNPNVPVAGGAATRRPRIAPVEVPAADAVMEVGEEQ